MLISFNKSAYSVYSPGSSRTYIVSGNGAKLSFKSSVSSSSFAGSGLVYTYEGNTGSKSVSF